jgi:hypothetical protein
MSGAATPAMHTSTGRVALIQRRGPKSEKLPGYGPGLGMEGQRRYKRSRCPGAGLAWRQMVVGCIRTGPSWFL